MKRSLLPLAALLALPTLALPSDVFYPSHLPQPAVFANPITLIPIANSGVLVAARGSKVLIDGLFDKPNPAYRAPAAETIDKMMKGEAPFDGVGLVLVTHNHADHFDPALGVRYLEARPEASLLAPADAVAEMRKLAADWAKIEPRVFALDLKNGEKAERTVKGIPVTAFRTLHGGSETPMNLMYLFEIGGRRVFHEGDSSASAEEWRSFGLGGAPLDLAVVHFWFPFVPNRARMLLEDLKPAHIALVHLPIEEESKYPGMVEGVRRVAWSWKDRYASDITSRLEKLAYKDLILLRPGMPAQILD